MSTRRLIHPEVDARPATATASMYHLRQPASLSVIGMQSIAGSGRDPCEDQGGGVAAVHLADSDASRRAKTGAHMRALSVKQPFAEQIARGDKKIEYRTWKVAPFGDLLIVASKTFHPSQNPKKWANEALVYGKAVCVVDFHKLTGTEGDYRWHLRHPRRVEPVAVKGFAALYTVEDSKIRYVENAGPVVAASNQTRCSPRQQSSASASSSDQQRGRARQARHESS